MLQLLEEPPLPPLEPQAEKLKMDCTGFELSASVAVEAVMETELALAGAGAEEKVEGFGVGGLVSGK